jgi:hypothetical protein
MVYLKIKPYYFLLILCSVVLIACKKGDIGPEGPIGPQGPQGEQGAQGPRGNPGTANVIYSNWASLAHNYRDSTIDLANRRINHIAVPQLTQAIMNNGVVLVYMRFNTTQFMQLPYTITSINAPIVMDYLAVVGKIIITRYNTLTAQPYALPSHLQYRYILIPGGTLAGGKMVDPRTLDYETVKKLYNIPD